MLHALLLAAALASPAPSPAQGSRCFDSFLGVGSLIAAPEDVVRGVQNSKPDRIIRVDVVQAKSLHDTPIVGFLYISQADRVLFSTRKRKNIDPAVVPLIHEIYAAASTATAAQLNHLLERQDGNAVLYLRNPNFLKRLPLRALPCVVLSSEVKAP